MRRNSIENAKKITIISKELLENRVAEIRGGKIQSKLRLLRITKVRRHSPEVVRSNESRFPVSSE